MGKAKLLVLTFISVLRFGKIVYHTQVSRGTQHEHGDLCLCNHALKLRFDEY